MNAFTMAGIFGVLVTCLLFVSTKAAPTDNTNSDDDCTDNYLLVGGTYSCNLLLVDDSRYAYVGAYLNTRLCTPENNYHGCCQSCRKLTERLQTTTTRTTKASPKSGGTDPSPTTTTTTTTQMTTEDPTYTGLNGKIGDNIDVEVDVEVWDGQDENPIRKAQHMAFKIFIGNRKRSQSLN